jgi:hypothetical protein
MTPIQQLMLGVGAKKKTYLDDMFSTYLYDGNSTTLSVNSGVDNTKGGMIWFKDRSGSETHLLFDTERGTSNYIQSNSTAAQTTGGAALTSFDNDGYTLGASAYQNNSGRTYTSWNFRKAPGFFTIKEYTGTGSAQSISHDLGSIPGCIMIKRLDSSTSWKVYHRGTGAEKALALDLTAAAVDNDNYWNDTEPTASVFTVKANTHLNASGATYVAYLFAGGESTADTARSVDFDGDDSLYNIGSSSDYTMGTGDFTIECWANFTGVGTEGLFQISDQAGGVTTTQTNLGIAMWNDRIEIYGTGGTAQYMMPRTRNQWYHFAYVRHSGVTKIYVDGTQVISRSDTGNYNGTYLAIGAIYNSSSFDHNGAISNFRIVKGTAVYTSSFKPSTVPLTNITNTKLLCCQGSSATGTTVQPGTITASGNPTASSDSPFDDPAGFVFGENEDQNVIKCGSYVGNGSATGPEINLGWEPQWLLIKNTNLSTEQWFIFDSMRGIASGSQDSFLEASRNVQEGNADLIDLTSTGFRIKINDDKVNNNGGKYIVLAIRRSDGYVGKPADAGTDVFAMDTGGSSSTIPNYDSGFPVDFVLDRNPAGASSNWWTAARLMGPYEVKTNATSAQSAETANTFDSNVGWNKSGNGSDRQSWMWKRHAGFDVVTYKGDGVAGHQIPHNLSKSPEMIWIKSRGSITQWCVGHKGRNGGVNPWNYFSALNGTGADEDNDIAFNDTAPTSTHFTVGGDDETANKNNFNYIAMLFASVDGISKVGYYDGSSSDVTVTTGFQPRFVIIKATNNTRGWTVLDTTRGWGSGVDNKIMLNSQGAQVNTWDYGTPTSNGFTVSHGQYDINFTGWKYVYYAHA